MPLPLALSALHLLHAALNSGSSCVRQPTACSVLSCCLPCACSSPWFTAVLQASHGCAASLSQPGCLTSMEMGRRARQPSAPACTPAGKAAASCCFCLNTADVQACHGTLQGKRGGIHRLPLSEAGAGSAGGEPLQQVHVPWAEYQLGATLQVELPEGSGPSQCWRQRVKAFCNAEGL